jgi:proteasome accessory factor C
MTGSSTALRVLELLKELRKRKLTFAQIQKLTTHAGKPTPRSTVYRDFQTLASLGFSVETLDDKYFIADTEGSLSGVKDLSQEEVVLIQDALMTYAPSNPLRNNILQKLIVADDLKPLADTLVRQQDIENIARLAEAIRLNRRAILRGYQSTQGERLSDRIVEPKRFLKEYQKVDCCEVETVKIKTFNIERIGSIEILPDAQSLNPDYEKMDIFGQAGFEENAVVLRLTKRAKLILEKESPDARQYIRDDGGGKYLLRTFYTRYEGVTRYILSLPGEIEIIHTETLRQHLNGELAKLGGGRW